MPVLVVLEGPNRGAVIPLLPGENRIGRDPGVKVRLPDTSVSRHHAAVIVAVGGAILRDLGSTNATYHNGILVQGQRTLRPGDELRLGNTVLLFRDEHAEKKSSDPHVAFADTSKIAALTAVNLTPPPELDVDPVRLPPALPVPSAPVGSQYLVGDSDAIKSVAEFVARCAPLESTVLIVGESGTGKELVAHALHRLSQRQAAPFMVVNCATLEPALLESELFGHERGSFTGAVARKLGKLELTRNGTLFLDEVGELPLEAQAKLLRAIEQREFMRIGGSDVLKSQARFVGATHRDLVSLCAQGRFREDLLFRLRVVEIEIPPLRKRPEDIPPLIAHFLGDLRKKIPARARDFTPEAIEALCRYPFRGNVRELKNIIERCLIFCERTHIEFQDLPAEVRLAVETADTPVPKLPSPFPPGPMAVPGQMPGESVTVRLGSMGSSRGVETDPTPVGHAFGSGESSVSTMADIEKSQILRALVATGGNKSKAARMLAIHRNTLYAMIKRYGIEP